MRDGWQRAPLGVLVELDIQKVTVEPAQTYPLVGVLAYGRGLLHRDPLTAESTKYRELNRVCANSLIFSRLKAFEGAITVAPNDLPVSYASQEFPTFNCTSRVLPDYLRMITQEPWLWEQMKARSKGLGGRRERLQPRDLLEVEVPIGPLAEQRRIVDLIGAVDDVIAQAKPAHELATSVLLSASEALLHRWDEVSTIGEMGPKRGLIGGPFGSSLTSRDYVADGVPVIRGTNLSGPTVEGPFVYVSEQKASTLNRNQALPGDVIFTQRGTLGQVAMVPASGPDRYVVSQSQMRLRVDPSRDVAKFVYYCFLAPTLVREIQSRNTATANPHINLGILSAFSIPRPTLEDQLAAVSELDAIQNCVDALAEYRSKLNLVRSNLLTALLSGEHEIPESYNELMGA